MHSTKRIPEVVIHRFMSGELDTDRGRGFAECGAHLRSWLSKMVYADFILGGLGMFELLLLFIAGTMVIASMLLWGRSRDLRREMLRHSITPEILHDLLETDLKPTVIDLRVPLDFLVHTEMIPGAQRIAPSEIIANPNMISKDQDYVLYCTCPGEDSSKTVLSTALKMGFLRVRVLTGGFEAWKQKGYPVEAYTKQFHLDVQ